MTDQSPSRSVENDRMDERIVETSGFLSDEQYQRSPELRKHWEQSGMDEVMRLIEREGLVVLDAPVGRWTEERSDDPDDVLSHYWRYRVRAHAIPKPPQSGARRDVRMTESFGQSDPSTPSTDDAREGR